VCSLKLLWLQKGIDEVRQETKRDEGKQRQFDHGLPALAANRSQPFV
jgi:hypothetical protein